MSIADVSRELLVRHLDRWLPVALRGARRATFVQAWSGPPDEASAEAALRVFAEFSDQIAGRRVTFLAIAPSADGLARRLDAIVADSGAPPELSVHVVAGAVDARLGAVLRAAGAGGAPLLAWLEAAEPPLKAVSTGRPAEVMLIGPCGPGAELVDAPRGGGFPLTAAVELVDGVECRLLVFGTSSAKSLEAFKNTLWLADEYAGVRYRDPHDPDQRLLDISLTPHLAPLRRELLAWLAATGERTVTDVRRFTLTETVYRASDAVSALGALLSTGAVTRRPEHGRLSGDVLVGLARPAPAALSRRA